MSSVIVVKHGFRRAVIAAGLRGAPGTGGSGSAGVTKFNNRTGAVTLNGTDVTTALGYTPANNASLAAVAFSGAYGALTGRPFIPAAPGDIGAASAAQGALADTAVQPAALTVLLDLKVDKIAGYGLSQENFTPAEKAKLAGLDGPLWKGTYTSLAALQSAHPTAEPGSSAHVDAGVGDPVKVYNWDASDGEWVAGGGDAAPITAAQVRTLYESNPDTNAFTDAEKSKLGGVAAGATANADTDSLPESATPTNKWFTVARVLAATLGGLSLAAGGPVLDTDSVLAGFGKLQRQINDLTTALSGKQATLVSGTNIKTINGESLVGPGNVTVTGGGSFDRLSTLTASEVAVSSGATLTSTAFGKMHICSGASDYTLVLPTASGNAGKIIGFRAARSAAAFITIDGSGSETVDGKSAFVIRAGEVLTLLSDGTNFEILDYRHCKVFAAATRTAVQTIAGVVFTKVQLNVIEGSNGNVGGAFDTTTYRFTAKRTRRHRVLGNLCLTAVGGVNDALSPRIYVNGSQVRFGGYSPSQVSTIMGASFAADLQLSAGDYVELFVYNHFNANRGIPADFAGCCNMTIEEGAE